MRGIRRGPLQSRSIASIHGHGKVAKARRTLLRDAKKKKKFGGKGVGKAIMKSEKFQKVARKIPKRTEVSDPGKGTIRKATVGEEMTMAGLRLQKGVKKRLNKRLAERGSTKRYSTKTEQRKIDDIQFGTGELARARRLQKAINQYNKLRNPKVPRDKHPLFREFLKKDRKGNLIQDAAGNNMIDFSSLKVLKQRGMDRKQAAAIASLPVAYGVASST